jgi:hypothetical protein
MDNRKKSKAPLVLTLIVLILIVGGSAHDFRKQQAEHKVFLSKMKPPMPTVPPVYLFATTTYQIAIPKEFQVKVDQQNGSVTFLKIIKLGVNQESLIISMKKTTEKDPCAKKISGYTHTSCKNAFDYKMLDWGIRPPEYQYTVISAGNEYTLHFFGFSEADKTKILETFRIT